MASEEASYIGRGSLEYLDPVTDIQLEPENHTVVVSGGGVVRLVAHDVLVDHPARRSTVAGLRRAMVHDFQDGLTINWAGDYPGGVTIHGNVRILDSLSVQNVNLHARIQQLASQVEMLQEKVAALEKRLKNNPPRR